MLRKVAKGQVCLGRLRRGCVVEAGCKEVLRLAAKRVDVEVAKWQAQGC
jgi:hypothetical protein